MNTWSARCLLPAPVVENPAFAAASEEARQSWRKALADAR
jgi:hypothetical protein